MRSGLAGRRAVGRYLARDADERRSDGKDRLSLLLPVLVDQCR
jgi:hypothetical protein